MFKAKIQRNFILFSIFFPVFIGLFQAPCAFSLSPEGEKQLFAILGEIKGQLKQMDKRITELRQDTNKRFEELRLDTNKRFNDTDNKISDLRKDNNKRSDEIITFLWIIAAIFTTITAAVIALLIWDRRTAVRYAVK